MSSYNLNNNTRMPDPIFTPKDHVTFTGLRIKEDGRDNRYNLKIKPIKYKKEETLLIMASSDGYVRSVSLVRIIDTNSRKGSDFVVVVNLMTDKVFPLHKGGKIKGVDTKENYIYAVEIIDTDKVDIEKEKRRLGYTW